MDALALAVSSGNGDILRLLVRYNGDMTLGSHPGGWTPVHLSARKNRSETLKLLMRLNERAVKTISASGATPLLTAVMDAPMKVKDEMVRILLEAYAEANACDQEGWNPLAVSVQRDYRQTCKLLVQNRGNVLETCPGPDGKKTLLIWHLAASHDGLQNAIKSKMNSRDLQKLQQRLKQEAEQRWMVAAAGK